jgi:hypothetical protein
MSTVGFHIISHYLVEKFKINFLLASLKSLTKSFKQPSSGSSFWPLDSQPPESLKVVSKAACNSENRLPMTAKEAGKKF